ncbi:disulfide bond formation protein DsbA [Williamsoniiplasma luminosum]|uniref:Disulfide bond formation protein DsbA n=1 Tax=Williamsoniiplasma luminosum TaxID=214888 RepID=A0A2K8NTW0_9MOLU|nr:DsbA family protein [Williamsoniiplasma luminosum]ATZ16986.1 disulfide bond formation protein DsbA [Williamsoniiplasma luminosum]
MIKNRIQLWIDFNSPLAYLMFKNLNKALLSLKNKKFEVEYKTFQVDPDFDNTKDYEISRFQNNVENAKKVLEKPKIKTMLKTHAIHINFDDIKPANTLEAHRLMHAYKDNEFQTDIINVIFLANFIHGLDISEVQTLIKITAQIDDINPRTIRNMYGTNKFLSDITADESLAIEHDIEQVPYIIFPNETAVQGILSVQEIIKELENL